MQKFAVVSKSSEEAMNASKNFTKKLKERNIDYIEAIPISTAKQEELNFCEAVFCFGGDGTILKASRLFTKTSPLIIGINFGRLGFLAEVDPSNVESVLDKVINRNFSYYLVERLSASVKTQDEVYVSPPAMNELYFTPPTPARLLTLKISASDVFVYKGRMDGLVISTAMGSTAYSLSSGGPIVDPECSANIITPMAPINIALRPIVVDKAKIINVVNMDSVRIQIVIDGIHWMDLKPGEHAEISQFNVPIRLYRAKVDLLKKFFDKRLSWDHSP
jgi:NAD+ kinase